jgi:hypothetical protein
VDNFNFFFEFLKNHHRNIIYINSFNFLNKFLYFQSCNYKIFLKIHHVSKVLNYMFKTLNKNMWTCDFFCFKCLFSLSCYMSYLLWKTVWKMHYKPTRNCHEENAVLGKDLNLGVINFFFHAFIQRYHLWFEVFDFWYIIICISWSLVMKSFWLLIFFSCPKHLRNIDGNTCALLQ